MTLDIEEAHDMERIHIMLAAGTVFPCAALFGRGVRLRVETGLSIRELLCGRLGVPEGYLTDRIQTLFLNGSTVDDVDRSRIEDGAVLSLSAAMPGLVGATLRRGGHLAALRKSISYKGGETEAEIRMGTVTIKLFNMVARELGPHFLQLGVLVSGRDLAEPLDAAKDDIVSLERDGKRATVSQVSDLIAADAQILLQVDSIA